VLGCLFVSSLIWVLPRLQTRFSFKDLFSRGHPAREAFDAFEENFDLGARITLYFHGARAFQGPFLKAAGDFAHQLRRRPGTRGVFSACDLHEPLVRERHQTLTRILREEVSDNPETLRARLQEPPFSTHFHGLLYDRELTTFFLTLSPPRKDENPREDRRYVEGVVRAAQDFARAQGVEVYLGGHKFLHHEVRRVGLQSQARLTLLAFGVQVLLFWVLFHSFLVALQVVFLLVLSVYFGFVAMGILGLPVTFLSVNLAIMVLVIGTADLVHMVGCYAALRLRYSPLGSCLRASRRTAVPVLLTSLTTSGCLLVTSATPLDQVRQFSLALAAGVMVTWAIAVVFGPLLFRRSGVEPGKGAYFLLHHQLASIFQGGGGGWLASPWIPRGFLALGVVSLLLVLGQRVDSNWYRYFEPGTPVARTLDFMEAHSLPVSQVDYTLDTDRSLFDTFDDQAMERDVRRITAAMKALPGILSVEHLYSRLDFVRGQLRGIRFPPEVPRFWQDKRREALLRTYVAAGSFDRYFSTRKRQLRLVALTTLEGSHELQAFHQRLRERVAELPLERVRPGDLQVTGRMHYWAAIVAEIPRTFLRNVVGCGFLVFFFFLALTGSLRLALLAMGPNILPVFVMFGVGRLAGIPMNENLCFVVSLAIGIAVDDTLHFLYHFHNARKRGWTLEEAIGSSLETAGAPMVVTSLLLGGGFALCLSSPVNPIRQMGILLLLAITSALTGDLLLLPALLLRQSPGPKPGEDRQYQVARRRS
jgi:predicted RND superfamily exporter protein